ncbi:MAG: cytochrome P450 [Planctomycetales bacterium]|nr:cytochrome P450 [Planctomycetales bacterium]
MKIAPGYKRWLPLPYGVLGTAVRNPLTFLTQSRQDFGDIVRLQLGPFVTHFVYHPDHVSHVLREQQSNYQRGWQYNLLRRLFGDNLVASEGEFWRRQRRLAQPAFHHQRLSAYADEMATATAGLINRWRQQAAAGEAVNVSHAMSRLALAIASRTLFSRDVSEDADAIGESFGAVGRFLDLRFKYPLTSPPVSWPTPGNRRFKRAARQLNEIVLALIRRRRDEGGDRGDLLSTLIRARDEESGEQMTDEQLRTEVLTFLIAGHETTAKALTWTIFLLASHAHFRQRVREEVHAVLGNRPPTVTDGPNLKSTRMAIDESLRLFPPVWIIARDAVEEDEIDGYHIPARSSVAISQYVTHRHPKFWEQPDVFDPDRFNAERSAGRPRGAYFPFLVGPHQCIGNEFAKLEILLVVAMIAQQFDFELLPGSDVRSVAALTLNPSVPVRIRLR